MTVSESVYINGQLKTVDSTRPLTDEDLEDLGATRQPPQEADAGTAWGHVKQLGRGALAVADVAQSAVTGAVAGLIGQAAGAGRVVTGQLGMHGKPETFDESTSAGADIVRRVGSKSTPLYTDTAKSVMEPVGRAIETGNQALGGILESAGEAVGPKTAAAGRTIGENFIQLGAEALGGKGIVKSVLSLTRLPISHAQDSLKKARDAGFRTDPSEANPTLLQTGLVKLSDQAALQKSLARYNANIVDRLAREDAKLGPNEWLNQVTLDKRKATEGVAYENIKNYKRPMSVDTEYQNAIRALDSDYAITKRAFPGAHENRKIEQLRANLFEPSKAHMGGLLTAEDIVETSKLFRNEAREILLRSSTTAEAAQLAYAKKRAAVALEQLLERRLSQSASGMAKDLIPAWRAAREQLAKLYTLEEVTNLQTGRVNPELIYDQMKAGVPLDGRLKTIAEAHETMKRVVKNVDGEVPNKNRSPYYHGGAGAVAGFVLGGPMGGAIGATVPSALRGAINSKIYQNSLGSVKPITQRHYRMQDAALVGAGAQPDDETSVSGP